MFETNEKPKCIYWVLDNAKECLSANKMSSSFKQEYFDMQNIN